MKLHVNQPARRITRIDIHLNDALLRPSERGWEQP